MSRNLIPYWLFEPCVITASVEIGETGTAVHVPLKEPILLPFGQKFYPGKPFCEILDGPHDGMLVWSRDLEGQNP